LGERIRTHLRSNVVGYVALFVALSGVAYAAGLKKNSVKSKHIRDGQVLTQDIGDGAVGTADLADGAVTAGKLANGVIPGPELTDGSVTTPKLADGSVDSAKLADDSVSASKVGANALGGDDIDESSLLGLDASTLGGTAPGGFALAGHNHDSTYVNEGQANSITAAMISDSTRRINLPLNSFIECSTDAGANINFSSGAGDRFPDFVNRATDGAGFFLRFDADAGFEDTAIDVCSQVQLPSDWQTSGALSLVVNAVQPSPSGTTERLHCGGGLDGAAPSFTNHNLGFDFPSTFPCSIPPGGAIQGDTVNVAFDITGLAGTMDSVVDVNSVALSYLSTR